jgi:hypothetical protein
MQPVKAPVARQNRINEREIKNIRFLGFVETFIFFKKMNTLTGGGFHPLPAPLPIG